MALSQALEDALLNWVLGASFPAPPAGVWLALHSGAVPSAENEITAWAGGSRLRLSPGDFAAASNAATGGRERLNSRALLLGQSSSSQNVASFALWDAATGGQILLTGDVVPDVIVNAGDPPIFLSGDLALQAQ